ncbi:Protein CBG11514 [Caenorhabditis briggsae]|uniref:Uncharacterized protein n=2 Tax=Caenorhabditis briggsae TaxID=6238 RepID=A0AAE9A2I2_CAEBR|nr:Protein CBG11514 [Caenorhabditis briggsae]ULT85766.1 hypothetical protein L3Y34_005867 [Caenorhabditis briggsae]ULT85767.1 hypothetical protein L3Y34_005867 [Caenorhabditis briggsae]CAP30454.1 Protein CBG11514 [Caenorhabditis briggsae]
MTLKSKAKSKSKSKPKSKPKSKNISVKSKKTPKNQPAMKEVSSKKKKQQEPKKKDKKVVRVPNRQRREPFKGLMISKKLAMLSTEKAYAFKIRKLGGDNTQFVKIDPLGEIMDNRAHKVGMPKRYSATVYEPPIGATGELLYYLYKTYNFMDDLTKYDIHRRADHYSNMIRWKRDSHYFKAGLAVCLSFQVRRRREKFRIRGKWRPQYSNYGKRMLESPRSLFTKMQKTAQPYFAQMIVSKRDEATAMATQLAHAAYQNFTNKETKGRIVKFMRHNNEWLNERSKCCQVPILLRFSRDRLTGNVVNGHRRMPYRRRVCQDLFSEFNYISSHLAFSVHFCRVLRNFRVNEAAEDEVIQKSGILTPLIRMRMSRYNYFPAISVVNYNENNELQTTIPRFPRRAPSICAVSGYSSDSSASAATDSPLDFLDWKLVDKELEHRMVFGGDTTRYNTRVASEKHYNERRWKEMERRKKLLYKANARFEMRNNVPILTEISKMHPPLIFCKLKGMELNKLRKSTFPPEMDPEVRDATAYLFKQRMNFLEKTLPCKKDPRILMTPGWTVFGIRENTETFENVARILKQRSSWVTKNAMSRAATVPRCDKLPMISDERHKKLFIVLILPLTIALTVVTFGMISFL